MSVDKENDEVTIARAVAHEIRLRPGQYPPKAVTDGKPVMSDVIAI